MKQMDILFGDGNHSSRFNFMYVLTWAALWVSEHLVCYGLEGGVGERNAFQSGRKLFSVGIWQTDERNKTPTKVLP
jgi:hypothetical protein